MDKKVLVFLRKDKLSPRGGPLGVGYYLYREIKKANNKWIEFLPPCEMENNNSSLKNDLVKFFSIFVWPPRTFDVNFNDYSIIHFHTVRDLYVYRGLLKDYNGIVLLTSHCPEPPAREAINRISKRCPSIMLNLMFKLFQYIDVFAFKKADYIFFPCEDAEEPYKKNWNFFNKLKKEKEDYFKYVLTGISKAIPERSRSSILEQHNIEKNNFVISYIGRHNYVKGYGDLVEIGRRILSTTSDCTFLIAGKIESISPLDNKNWIEVGYTTDAHSYMNACDVFILPNKETYFDLVMLEVISLGKPVVASRTGGNKFFEKKGANGIFLYDSIDEAINIIKMLSKKDSKTLQKLGESNREFYYNYCTSEKMYNSYVQQIEEIIAKNNNN